MDPSPGSGPVGPVDRVAESVSVNDAAALAGKHPQTIRRWIKDGTLAGFQLGHRELRVTRESLERFVGTAAPPPERRARQRPAGGLFDPEWGSFDYEPFNRRDG